MRLPAASCACLCACGVGRSDARADFTTPRKRPLGLCCGAALAGTTCQASRTARLAIADRHARRPAACLWRASVLWRSIPGESSAPEARIASVRRNGAVIKLENGDEKLRFAFYEGWIKSSKFADLEAASTNLFKQTVEIEHNGLERVK